MGSPERCIFVEARRFDCSAPFLQPESLLRDPPTSNLADRAELKKAGLKATLPRLKILSVLELHADLHMSAEDVYRALFASGEEVGLATVYRVLTQFEAAGLVIRHNFAEGHAVFELDSGEHHDHIVCADCGEVIEFIDATIERRQTQIAKRHGFALTESLSRAPRPLPTQGLSETQHRLTQERVSADRPKGKAYSYTALGRTHDQHSRLSCGSSG